VRRRGAAGALLAGALALATGGCGIFTPDIRPANVERDCAGSSGTTSQEASRLLLEGSRVFDERCSPCHGETGHGDGMLAELLPIRPRNYHEEQFRWGASWEQIAATVRGGRSGVMPPFIEALSEPEIRAVSFLVACWVERRGD
jgi:mono/diheme cytochrome c family protein